MAKWAYLFEHPEADPLEHRMVVDHSGQSSTMVAVPDARAAVDVARELAADGAQLIELCGGFTSADAARVRDAVPPHVAVGHVTFAMESIAAAAAYGAASET